MEPTKLLRSSPFPKCSLNGSESAISVKSQLRAAAAAAAAAPHRPDLPDSAENEIRKCSPDTSLAAFWPGPDGARYPAISRPEAFGIFKNPSIVRACQHHALSINAPVTNYFGPPTILVRPQTQQVKAGGIASFYCTAEGLPAPQIHWRKNGKRVSQSQSRYLVQNYENGALLRIEPVKPVRDNTMYECLAENGVGDAVSADAQLTVYEAEKLPSGFPLISQAPQTKVVEMGHNAVLPCTAVGSPAPIVSWVRDMLPIDTTNPRYKVLESGKCISSSFQLFHGRRGKATVHPMAKLGGACHISSSARVRKSLSTRGSVDRVVTRYGNIHLVCRDRAPALLCSALLCSALLCSALRAYICICICISSLTENRSNQQPPSFRDAVAIKPPPRYSPVAPALVPGQVDN
ncbi:Tyrosine-protein phosphatase Lar [Habropoda laboriosa]|uniref:Tyrosine-protein phosphatase Lar n=1 Tax=Habropoda laboriosa TaxID=597456 RepID=A0A0L7RCZ8_9HYME|nr:Tyrosine-protein phosphatase Lar [Habropoda laboriosa]